MKRFNFSSNVVLSLLVLFIALSAQAQTLIPCSSGVEVSTSRSLIAGSKINMHIPANLDYHITYEAAATNGGTDLRLKTATSETTLKNFPPGVIFSYKILGLPGGDPYIVWMTAEDLTVNVRVTMRIENLLNSSQQLQFSYFTLFDLSYFDIALTSDGTNYVLKLAEYFQAPNTTFVRSCSFPTGCLSPGALTAVTNPLISSVCLLGGTPHFTANGVRLAVYNRHPCQLCHTDYA